MSGSTVMVSTIRTGVALISTLSGMIIFHVHVTTCIRHLMMHPSFLFNGRQQTSHYPLQRR